jgi:hypothetical protein
MTNDGGAGVFNNANESVSRSGTRYIHSPHLAVPVHRRRRTGQRETRSFTPVYVGGRRRKKEKKEKATWGKDRTAPISARFAVVLRWRSAASKVCAVVAVAPSNSRDPRTTVRAMVPNKCPHLRGMAATRNSSKDPSPLASLTAPNTNTATRATSLLLPVSTHRNRARLRECPRHRLRRATQPKALWHSLHQDTPGEGINERMKLLRDHCNVDKKEKGRCS